MSSSSPITLLPMLNGSLAADIIILFIVYYTRFFNSVHLKKWYETYRLSAVIADVLILMIGMMITNFIFKTMAWNWTLAKYILVILLVQITHDILFYLFIKNIPRSSNKMLDTFKDYAKEVKTGAILGDSFMMVLSVLIAYVCAKQATEINLYILVLLGYLVPYFIFSR